MGGKKSLSLVDKHKKNSNKKNENKKKELARFLLNFFQTSLLSTRVTACFIASLGRLVVTWISWARRPERATSA